MPAGVKAFIKRNVQKDMTQTYQHDLPGMSQEPSAPEPVRSDSWGKKLCFALLNMACLL